MSPNKWLAAVCGSADRSWVRPGQNPPGRSQPKVGRFLIQEKEVGPCRGPAQWTGNLRGGLGKGPDSWDPPETGTVSRRSRPKLDWRRGWSTRRGTGRNLVVCNLPGSGGRRSRQSQRRAGVPSRAGAGVEALAKWRPELVAVSSRQRMAACRRDQGHS
ncbi:hypothetical protein NDU88_000636 [Pleurodeles waltl]|uniref:Uncharacterized protein n=1 Tax=Pleurodeles waltl TaxID=8319 RepID=A0AAV7TG11_PLEWA|nr:hypothetical protein NDU88_000636 [Pleurodeles waltl]